MRSALTLAFAAAAVASASAKNIVITVGGNTTSNAGAVFQPQTVVAVQGDTVTFNFTQGNHTATQSTFASPCIPAHFTNASINGFDSSFRNAGNFTAITTLPVQITDNSTVWFFDANTCAQGGVGGINVNESSFQTIDGFSRNAQRLNGTASISSTASRTSTSGSGTQTSTSPGSSNTSSDATRALTLGASALVPVLLALAGVSI